jgi:hypothetical protein
LQQLPAVRNAGRNNDGLWHGSRQILHIDFARLCLDFVYITPVFFGIYNESFIARTARDNANNAITLQRMEQPCQAKNDLPESPEERQLPRDPLGTESEGRAEKVPSLPPFQTRLTTVETKDSIQLLA